MERSFGHNRRTRHDGQHGGFNPCFGGEVVWTESGEQYEPPFSKFQSLFWWRGRLDLYMGLRGRVCVGSVSILVLVERSFGHEEGQFKWDNEKFQSLFWWRGRLDTKDSWGLKDSIMFQSLFWWRGRLDSLVSTVFIRSFADIFKPSSVRQSYCPVFKEPIGQILLKQQLRHRLSNAASGIAPESITLLVPASVRSASSLIPSSTGYSFTTRLPFA